ncbi:hypothetical protein PG2006B_1090 [Bifidobacterium animalis subsp. animalis]|uniref:hypothetical protein n=1 Tax=Bifidobacterium animalis TaxID=28025 RepID=UPI0010211E29|nr:hypothetical protein [Bifidobacterium animalis]RYN13516.1 hypothetical protein PG2006B_1090 [Bifidobacterium animalis subsp. animalis]
MTQVQNLLRDPWPNSARRWACDDPADLILRMTNNGESIYMETTAANRNLFIRHNPGNLDGKYVFAVNVTDLSAGASTYLIVYNMGNWHALGKSNTISQANMLAVSFTVDNAPVQLRIQCGSAIGQKMNVKNLLLMTAEDWIAMRADPEQIVWFAPPKNGVSMQPYVPNLLTGGGYPSNPDRCYPHIDVEAVA